MFPIMSQEAVPTPRPLIRDLDSLPLPDYDHYFTALEASTLSNLIEPALLAESSAAAGGEKNFTAPSAGLMALE